jgi:hypothetical protein
MVWCLVKYRDNFTFYLGNSRYLPTWCRVLFWEAESCLAGQEIPHIFLSLTSHYVHKSPQLDPILSKMNPVHTITSYFCKTCSYIILLPTLRSPKLSFPLLFLTKILYAYLNILDLITLIIISDE